MKLNLLEMGQANLIRKTLSYFNHSEPVTLDEFLEWNMCKNFSKQELKRILIFMADNLLIRFEVIDREASLYLGFKYIGWK